MKWISEKPPKYIWPNDQWIRSIDQKLFQADLPNNQWISSDKESIPFSPHSIIKRDAITTISNED